MILSKFYNSLIKHGILGTISIIADIYYLHWSRFYHRNKIEYNNPTTEDFRLITEKLLQSNIQIENLVIAASDFDEFKKEFPFPDDYHGGKEGRVWNEKIFEHFIAFQLCGIRQFNDHDVYIDVAAGSSPWAMILRNKGVTAYAIDLVISDKFSNLSYYKISDATRTDFPDGSVRAISLQCAFEMFIKDSDTKLIQECARILKPGGTAVIVPLYLHTHYCGYSSPDFYGKGYADDTAKQYICKNISHVPFSRKYDARALKERIISNLPATLNYHLLELQNAYQISPDIYCHYILVLNKF